jgi:hypothetical protein
MSLAGAAACAEGAARSGAVAPAHESTARKQTAAEPRILIV